MVIVFLMPYGCYCSLSFSLVVVVWSIVCDSVQSRAVFLLLSIHCLLLFSLCVDSCVWYLFCVVFVVPLWFINTIAWGGSLFSLIDLVLIINTVLKRGLLLLYFFGSK